MLQRIVLLIVFSVEAVGAIGSLWPHCYGPGDTCCDNCSQIAGGAWSTWNDYTSCSKTCGYFGKKVQRRTCDSWWFGCACTGPYSRLVPCSPAPCPKAPECMAPYTKYKAASGQFLCGNVTNAENYAVAYCTDVWDGPLNCFPCPTGGVWSAWSNVGQCSATCGLCGKVNQTRTCQSTSYGCPCTGPTFQQYTCPKVPCPATPKCCGGNLVVKNMVTNASQCGLQLAPAQVLHPVVCLSSTTTTTTTPPPCAGGCSQNLATFKRAGDDGTLTFTYSTDGAGCMTAKYLCDYTPKRQVYFAIRYTNATYSVTTHDDFGQPPLQEDATVTFRCVIGNEWQYRNIPVNKFLCNTKSAV